MLPEKVEGLFNRSNMPVGHGQHMSPPQPSKPDPGVGPLTSPDSGKSIAFPSLSSQGRVLLDLPCGTNDWICAEQVQAKDLPSHIITQTEKGFSNGRSDDAITTFAHYAGTLKGLSLLDDHSQQRMSELSRQFAKASDPVEFFDSTIEPFLSSLQPKAR